MSTKKKGRKALGEFVWVLDGKTLHPARLAFPRNLNQNPTKTETTHAASSNNDNDGSTTGTSNDNNDNNFFKNSRSEEETSIEIQWTSTGKFQIVPFVNVSFPNQQQQQGEGEEGKQRPRRRSAIKCEAVFSKRSSDDGDDDDDDDDVSQQQQFQKKKKRKSTATTKTSSSQAHKNCKIAALSSADENNNNDDDHSFQNCRVARWFYTNKTKNILKLYFGTVTTCHNYSNGRKLWHIEYDDGDSEAMCLEDLQDAMRLFQEKNSKNSTATKTTAAAAAATAPGGSGGEQEEGDVDTTTEPAAMTPGDDKQQAKADTIISKLSFSSTNNNNNNNKYLYQRIAKSFYGKNDYGNIVGLNHNYWIVSYDDGDREDWDEDELKKGIQLCRQQQEQQCKNSSNKNNYTLWQIFNLYNENDRIAWASTSISAAAASTSSSSTTNKRRKLLFPKELRTNPERVSKFFLMMLERQHCWIRRRGLKMIGNNNTNNNDNNHHCNWTNSRLLRDYYFCNNYRELDRGTVFLHNHIVRNLWKGHAAEMNKKNNSSSSSDDDSSGNKSEWKEWFEAVLWASYCYRLVNKVESFSNVGELPTSDFGRIPTRKEWTTVFKGLVLKIQEARNNDKELPGFFTGAHQTCNHHNYVKWMDEIADPKSQQWCQVMEVVIEHDDSLEAIYQAILNNFPGCGAFMSWQICCDLLESNALPKIKSIDFCVLGKGAKAGIGEIFFGTDHPPKGVKNEEYLRLTKLLVEYQDDVLRLLKSRDGIELVFPKFRNKPIGLKEMEHALCEFSKWQRIERGIYGRQQQRPIGQRLRKSRSHLDLKLQCQSCYEDLYKTTTTTTNIIILCCTCMQGYCKKCLPNPLSSDPIYWMCKPCLDFERYEWKNLD